jgi:hypothetical protein
MVSDDVGFQYTFAFWATSLSILSVIFLVHAYFVREYISKPKIKEGFKFSSPVFSAMYDTIVALWNLCFGDGEGNITPKQRLVPGIGVGFNLVRTEARESSMVVEPNSVHSSKSRPEPAKFSLHEDF